MDDKTKQLISQLKDDPTILRSLIDSRDGQALMQMLTRNDQGAALQRAARSAAQGDPAALTQMVEQVMHSPGGAELIGRIGRAVKK